MKKLECNHCDETVVLADGVGEMVTSGETPLEHMRRTGHSPKSPVTMICEDCGNVWPYTGNADRATCSNCRGKRTSPVDTDD